ncbi:MAG: DUF1801 domain-containing protein [Bacteroidetes bacterium]|nr:DUF1801 domain-containing protein [Bacteroidota bacterium]
MGKSPPLTVEAYLQALDHPQKVTLQALRRIVLAASDQVGEQIKWNSLSFYYAGEMQAFDARAYLRDILVCNLNKPDFVLLVFPTGARVPDGKGLLTGTYADGRRMVRIASEEEALQQAEALQAIVLQWLAQVE